MKGNPRGIPGLSLGAVYVSLFHLKRASLASRTMQVYPEA